MMKKGALEIIPARGGSKRIPRKNIKPFLGKPIIAYSIEAAINSKLFDTIMVSTDDAEIAEVAKQYGAEVPFMRSDKNSNDYAGTAEVLIEVLEAYTNIGSSFETACCIYPTAPFITPIRLNEAFEKLEKNKYDTVFPIVRFSYPIQRALRICDDKKVKMFQPENFSKRSQDLETAYHDVGQFYFFKTKEFLEKKLLWTDNTGSIVLSELEAQDLDDVSDWEMAELKMKLKSTDT